MYRTFVILRHTFLESIVQPIYSLMLGLGAAIVFVLTFLPFFTLGEDAVMYTAVCLDLVLLFVLISTLFATSKSIFEEIEDRTMLTLMSKPVAKWEVLLGKYLGIILSAGMAIALLGGLIALCVWWRVPGDYQLNVASLDDIERQNIYLTRMSHIVGIGPSLLLMWFQISVLAAISVAISTRLSLVVNLPAVIIIYFAGNLTQFLSSGWVSNAVSTVLPFLSNFDLRQKTVYGHIALAGTNMVNEVNVVRISEIWSYTFWAGLYAVCYITLALSVGMLMFQTRELGGGEG